MHKHPQADDRNRPPAEGTGKPGAAGASSASQEIDSYLVRVVRRKGELFAGTVEQVRSGRVASFATLDELCALISGRRRFAQRPPHQTRDT